MRSRILLFSLLLIFMANLGLTEESPDEWFKKGNEASEAGDHEEAIRCFERTIALDPGHIGGFRNIGCVYGMRGMWDEAIEPFIKALAINPNDAQIHYNLGFCWYKKSMFDEAIAEFEKAVALNPEFRDAYHNLGIVYGKKEMFSQAIPMFRKAVEIGPDNAETHFSLGKAYKEVGDDTLAADHYYKAGLLYLQKGHREGALAAYENVVPYSKEIADVLFRRLYPDEEASDVTTPFFSQREVGGGIVKRPFSEEEISDSTSPLPSHQKAEVSDVTKPSTSDQEEEVSDVPKPLPSVKAESWYVLLRRMNLRQDPFTGGKIISKLNKNTEFQIMEESPDNNPSNAWYLIRTRSGFTGWLSGIYNGNVKFKDLPQPDIVQKEIAGDLVNKPHSEGEASDLIEPLVSDQEEEASDVPEPLPSEQEEEVADSTRPLSSEQEQEVAGLTRLSPSEQEEEVFEVETPLPLEPQEEASGVPKPLPSEQEQEVSEVTEPIPPDQEDEVSEVSKPFPSVKAESRYVLLRRMNLRQDPFTGGKIISKLNKNTEFQIMEEAPDNNPSNAWYLIRTRSGFTGWLSGIYNGNVKFKDLPQPDLVQKEMAADIVKTPHSEGEASDLIEPLVSNQEEEASDVPEPLPSEQEEEVADSTRPLSSEQEEEVAGLTRLSPSEQEEEVFEVETPLPLEPQEEASDLIEPLPSEQEQEVSEVTEPIPPDQEEEVSDVSKPFPSVKAESWYVLLRRMNLRQDPFTGGKIISKLNKNTEFQIMEEAPDNNPSNAWYLIRTRSGITGWLSGIYNGNVKFKDLPQPDLVQKEMAADIAKTPHSEEEVSEVSKPLLSVKAESWYVLLRRMNIRQDPSTTGKIISKLNKNAEFQIIEEAPDNNPSNAWYLIRTRSGITGWLSGIYNGNVKFKDLSQPDFLSPR